MKQTKRLKTRIDAARAEGIAVALLLMRTGKYLPVEFVPRGNLDTDAWHVCFNVGDCTHIDIRVDDTGDVQFMETQ